MVLVSPFARQLTPPRLVVDQAPSRRNKGHRASPAPQSHDQFQLGSSLSARFGLICLHASSALEIFVAGTPRVCHVWRTGNGPSIIGRNGYRHGRGHLCTKIMNGSWVICIADSQESMAIAWLMLDAG
ncbi:predicted protein [Plenodomus lingam JN3]|uniref:Predicted protein n=1 Tax=Leptosphaeria maculans (strain JN3 / isolate v23.1.3 / race Av1-4-5-6-7-8) TaxID=985895 RepID=E5ADY3_LEPMJ|nr:predicted protein [Plenodomus lingam JN3]CBY01422.1 predicted protein [Plenodomus lingam JN3]